MRIQYRIRNPKFPIGNYWGEPVPVEAKCFGEYWVGVIEGMSPTDVLPCSDDAETFQVDGGAVEIRIHTAHVA